MLQKGDYLSSLEYSYFLPALAAGFSFLLLEIYWVEDKTMMISIITLGIAAQTVLQWVIDTTVINTVFGVHRGKKIRYYLATNIPFRAVWNITSGLPLAGLLFGDMGLYASIIFLVSNGVYEIICRIRLYRKWKQEFEESGEVHTVAVKKAHIRKDLLKRARKENLIIFYDELQTMVNREYNRLHLSEVKEQFRKERRAKAAFVNNYQYEP